MTEKERKYWIAVLEKEKSMLELAIAICLLAQQKEKKHVKMNRCIK